MKKFGLIAVVAVLLIIGGVWWSNNYPFDSDGQNASTILSRNGMHWHPELEIYVKGEKIEIPHNVGLGAVHNPIHTHEDLPIIHMEFEGRVTEEDTRLGNFFEIWNKEFSGTQLFEHVNGVEGTVRMFVNGEENTEFENYHMRDGDKIEIRYE